MKFANLGKLQPQNKMWESLLLWKVWVLMWGSPVTSDGSPGEVFPPIGGVFPPSHRPRGGLLPSPTFWPPGPTHPQGWTTSHFFDNIGMNLIYVQHISATTLIKSSQSPIYSQIDSTTLPFKSQSLAPNHHSNSSLICYVQSVSQLSNAQLENYQPSHELMNLVTTLQIYIFPYMYIHC